MLKGSDVAWTSFMEVMRDFVSAQLAGVTAELEAPSVNHWVGETRGDGGDQAIAQNELCLSVQRRRELESRQADLEAALARMQNGTFGLCEKCGLRIEQDRLEATDGLALYHTGCTPTGRIQNKRKKR